MKKPLILALLPAALDAADISANDPSAFAKCVDPNARVEKLATGMKFIEGPVWIGGADGFLVFSDIPSNELKKWSAAGGLATFRQPSNNTNGNTTDNDGHLVSAEHSARRVSRTESDGTVKMVVDRVDGKRFNSPNDVVVAADGTVWFTDPPYGLPQGESKELDGHFVFRHDPKTGKTTIVARDQQMPNGLALSPDGKKLYVADSGRARQIWVYDVKDDGSLAGGKVFCTIDKGGPDGIRVDADGRLWSSAGDGVHVFDQSGKLLGKILCPEAPANLCFGGKDGKTLFMTARTSLYSVPVLVTDARSPRKTP